jgi:hypothetical protein
MCLPVLVALEPQLDHPSRISYRYTEWKNVLSHHCAGTNNRAIPDLNTTKHDRTTADPDVATDLHAIKLNCLAVTYPCRQSHRNPDLTCIVIRPTHYLDASPDETEIPNSPIDFNNRALTDRHIAPDDQPVQGIDGTASSHPQVLPENYIASYG